MQDCVLCFACEAWSTHRDHVDVGVVTLFCFPSIAFEGMHQYIPTLQKDQVSFNTGKVQKGGNPQNFGGVMALF